MKLFTCEAIIVMMISVQQFYGIWLIYITSSDARKQILSGFEMKVRQIKVYDENPFKDIFKKSERMIVSYSIPRQKILKHLSDHYYPIQQSGIQYSRIYDENDTN